MMAAVSSPRGHVVEKLVEWGNYALARGAEHTGATGAEVFQAYLAMARDALVAARNLGVSVDSLRASVSTMLIHLEDTTKKPS